MYIGTKSLTRPHASLGIKAMIKSSLQKAMSNDFIKQTARKLVPVSLHSPARQLRALITRRSTPRFQTWNYNLWPVLQCDIAYNQFGGYCVPLSSRQRIASQVVLWGDVFEPLTIEFIVKHIKDGDVIHAGAFFGDFLPALSRACTNSCSIWAFEPEPENYRCAAVTILINDLKNVNLVNAGLGEATGVGELVIRDDNGTALGELSHIRKHSGQKLLNATPVKIVAIDDVIAKDRKITVLHLDVEGYEQQALTGALGTIRRHRPILILESLPSQEWFIKNLEPLGYRIDQKIEHNTLLVSTSIG
jgi:FkbM family methyltransferase